MTDKTEKPWDGHTELPWRLTDDADDYIGRKPVAVQGPGQYQTVACNTTYYPTAIKPADAALIVHRVNKGPAADAMADKAEALIEIAKRGKGVTAEALNDLMDKVAAYRETDK